MKLVMDTRVMEKGRRKASRVGEEGVVGMGRGWVEEAGEWRDRREEEEEVEDAGVVRVAEDGWVSE